MSALACTPAPALIARNHSTHAVLTACSICTKEFDTEDLHTSCPHCKSVTCEACDYKCHCDPRTKLLRFIGIRSLYVVELMKEMAELNAAALIKPLKKSQIQRLKAITVTIEKSKKVFSLCAKLAA
jgi:hypothetical protein